MNAFTPEDLDFVMFICITTMGGDASFQFFLPRFLKAVLDGYPGFVWLSRSHVMASKCERVEWSKWKLRGRDAVFGALEAFAQFEEATDRAESSESHGHAG
ncbi:MAG: hypothetical protein FJW31_15800 [Acidobacteria bacterium]|nr:hypothetical protein [Acidobacteriota bacterium]